MGPKVGVADPRYSSSATGAALVVTVERPEVSLGGIFTPAAVLGPVSAGSCPAGLSIRFAGASNVLPVVASAASILRTSVLAFATFSAYKSGLLSARGLSVAVKTLF